MKEDYGLAAGIIVIFIGVILFATLLFACSAHPESVCNAGAQHVFTKNITIFDTEVSGLFTWNPFYLYSAERVRYEIPGTSLELYTQANRLTGCNVAIRYTCQDGHCTISAILPLSCPTNTCGCGYQSCGCGCGVNNHADVVAQENNPFSYKE